MPPANALSAVVVSGGVAHDFPATSEALRQVLGEVGLTATIRTDVEASLCQLAEADTGARPLVVLNLLRWTMQVERYAHLRDEWSLSLTPQAQRALVAHVHGGGGLLAMHGASICFDDWAGWRDLLGGVWDWERSSHPPLGDAVDITVATGQHPIVQDVADFSVPDEVYGFLDRTPDVSGLMSSAHGGTEHPLLWAREIGAGRVVYDALGHDVRSYESPTHRTIVQRAALWACGSL